MNTSDISEQVHEIFSLAMAGDAQALYQLGEQYSGEQSADCDLPRDPIRAAWCYREAAEMGHGMAQFRLGYYYKVPQPREHGDIAVGPDLRKAYVWTCLAAEQGLKAAYRLREVITAHIQEHMDPSDMDAADRLLDHYRGVCNVFSPPPEQQDTQTDDYDETPSGPSP